MTMLRMLSVPGWIPPSARMFLALLGRIQTGSLALVTPDGDRCLFGKMRGNTRGVTHGKTDDNAPAATLHLHDWRACRAILRAGDIGFAEAYRANWLDSPDLTALLRLAIANERALPATIAGGRLAQLWYGLRHRLRPNTRAGSRRNIHAHYDLGNDFYALWLDPTFAYSSALFEGDMQRSLEAAQLAKYQCIFDTLGLRVGMKVLEVGCGWGGFATFAAERGIEMHAVTISPEQLALARARATTQPLSPAVRFELRDYRDLDGQYDAIVSIEMFEAVGERFWPGYFAMLRRCLKAGGRALVQSITIADRQFAAYRSSSDFIREFIFPGGMLPSPERFIAAASEGGLRAAPTLAFGRDYAQTLRLWRAKFEARIEFVRALGFDELFIRTWRLYFAYCEAGFDEGRTDVYQFLLARSE
ncbi:SAM-dependent methyltransferase [Paraburkholderia phosphatilytica]|uniref:SAM-dependent methyltransferase n=1 Tax=Paraburkholderia phosphatilytica TaxID=2282883 RepID=UPI000E521BB5|nr:cyclopropane-fatty-acyl-phospholipid synthase family protein [Paraburkholderia phosphatilytica]